MKKWKAILFGTLLTLSLCTFTACGTEVNNADETAVSYTHLTLPTTSRV
mgnify:CR=1 FL=1